MRRVLALFAALHGASACTAEPLRDRPEGMLAPFPADADGKDVPHERMVPYLVEQAVSLALKIPPRPPPASRVDPLVDLRNEPVLVLASSDAVGIGAPWPQERVFTLRPPTRAELSLTPLPPLHAGSSLEDWQPALAWLRAEAGRTRPGLQRYTETVLIVAGGDAPAEDARAAAAVLTRLGAARKARIAVVGPDGLWGALPLPASTLPVAALEQLASQARAQQPRPPAREDGVQDRLAAVLAQPIPGPRCVPVEAPSPAAVRTAVAATLAAAGPQDTVAVRGFAPTLAQYLDPAPITGVDPGRAQLGDACE